LPAGIKHEVAAALAALLQFCKAVVFVAALADGDAP
jgi:hypothetical protein